MTLPSLMLFVPCERVILDSLTNRLTLSFIMESVQPYPFSVSDLQELPDAPPEVLERIKQGKFLLPPINMICIWSGEGIADQDDFVTCVTLTTTDGLEVPFTSAVQFRFDGAAVHRVMLISNPTTGRKFGIVRLCVKVKRAKEEEWHTAGTYPLIIEEIPVVPEANQPPMPQIMQ